MVIIVVVVSSFPYCPSDDIVIVIEESWASRVWSPPQIMYPVGVPPVGSFGGVSRRIRTVQFFYRLGDKVALLFVFMGPRGLYIIVTVATTFTVAAAGIGIIFRT